MIILPNKAIQSWVCSTTFKQVNSIENQKCIVQDMVAKFPSSKQCRIQNWDQTTL